MSKEIAGIVLYRWRESLEVLLAHPGGPFWRNKDDGAWTIPKGEPAANESYEAAARREFREELGLEPIGSLRPLARIRQRGGKWVVAFMLEGEFDVASLRSNVFELEWPPRSGKTASFPEVDRVEWFTLALARRKILDSQIALLDQLETTLSAASS